MPPGRPFRTRYYVIAVLACFAIAPAVAAASPIAVTAALSQTKLKDGSSSGCGTLLFKVVNLPLMPTDPPYPSPTVRSLATDVGSPLIMIQKEEAVPVARLASGELYSAVVCVKDLALNSSFSGSILVQFDGGKDKTKQPYSEVLTYVFTNTSPTVDAEVSPGADTIFLDRSRETAFTVNVKGSPLRGLGVCQATLADANTGDRLDEQDLTLYLGAPDDRLNPQEGSKFLTLTAPNPRVHLYVSPTFSMKGVYTGTVALCSASKASVGTLKLTVNSTSPAAKTLGAFLILVGITLYVMVAVVLKQRSLQLTTMLPVSRLVEALRGLKSTAESVAKESGCKLPTLLGRIDHQHSIAWLINQLSLSKIRAAGLPPLLTNPFQPTDLGTAFQQYLQDLSTQEVNVAIIVHEGLEQIMSLDPMPSKASLANALGQLDELAREANTPDAMRPKVDAIVNAVTPHPIAFTPNDFIAHLQRRSATVPSVHEITYQLEFLSGLGWIVWAVLSFSMGFAVLILSNHGFGTWHDLLKCLLWGFGVQAAGQGLQAITPSSASSSFSLNVRQ